jgi:Fe-S-cluster containining protein
MPQYAAGLVEDLGTYIIPQPCRYLMNNVCSVHDIKPSVCRKYPFHQRKPVDANTAWTVIAGCPGTGNILRLIQNGKQLGLEYLHF